MSDTKHILFVCMGNICRSPTGEGVFHAYVQQQGVANRVHVDSAGTIGYHEGSPADPRMRQAAGRRGYDLTSIARQVRHEDLAEFDLIIAMDRDNLDGVEHLAGGPSDHIRLLGEFLDGYDRETAPDVPDPYYGGDEGFERVLDMIEAACPAMLAHLLDRPA